MYSSIPRNGYGGEILRYAQNDAQGKTSAQDVLLLFSFRGTKSSLACTDPREMSFAWVSTSLFDDSLRECEANRRGDVDRGEIRGREGAVLVDAQERDAALVLIAAQKEFSAGKQVDVAGILAARLGDAQELERSVRLHGEGRRRIVAAVGGIEETAAFADADRRAGRFAIKIGGQRGDGLLELHAAFAEVVVYIDLGDQLTYDIGGLAVLGEDHVAGTRARRGDIHFDGAFKHSALFLCVGMQHDAVDAQIHHA